MRQRYGSRPAARYVHRAAARARMLALACLLVGAPTLLKADPASRDSVHAAYLINFMRYAKWPPQAMDPGRHVVVVVGPAAAASTLRELAARAGPVAGRAVMVRGLSVNAGAPARADALRLLAPELERAHVVYVAESHRAWNATVVQAAAGRPVLTVGVGGDFIRSGGMLALFEDRGRVSFSANPEAIQRATVDLSARVMVLSRPLGPED